MTFVWTPFGIAGLIAGVTAWTAALFILRTTPDVRVRRRFALLLFLEGLMILTSWAGPLVWIGDKTLFYNLALLHIVNDSLLVAVYLPTIATVLNTRLVRLFRKLPWMLIPIGLGLLGATATILFPELFDGELVAAPAGYGTYFSFGGPLWPLVFLMLTLSYTYGLVATIFAWKRADSPLSRRRNGFLAIAFGTRDLFWGGIFLFGAVVTLQDTGEPMDARLAFWSVQIAACSLIVYILLTAYGIATAHLFDIDLKIKWTLQRGTVMAAYVAVFFVVSEGTAAILSEQVGTVVGLLATGALLFGLAPIQRWAERVSDSAMPNVQDTPEFRKFRKLEIYGEAFTDALRRGDLGAVQRAALNNLRDELQLTAVDAKQLEGQLSTG